jgi:CheY-like chemotaxis protein
MESLFSPFQQTQRPAGDTGLGLYCLAKRIEALKGQYGVSKRRDGTEGSIFWFSIPYRPDLSEESRILVFLSSTVDENAHTTSMKMISPPLQIDNQTRPPDHNSSSLSSPRLSMTSRTLRTPRLVNKTLNILIADDSSAIIKMTAMMLRRHGHVIATAENGSIALQLYENSLNKEVSKQPFDVILMDLQMHVMDGLEAVREIRQHERDLLRQSGIARQEQRIIGVSANSDGDTIEEAFVAGIDAFIAKPFTMDEFDRTVARLLAPPTPHSIHDIETG